MMASAVVATGGKKLLKFRTWNNDTTGENMVFVTYRRSVETRSFRRCVFSKMLPEFSADL